KCRSPRPTNTRRKSWSKTCWRATPRKASALSSRSASRNGRTADLGPLAMNHDSYPDSYIRGILNTVKSIAMVGASEKENRPSYFAFKYLLERGYNMLPINPGHAGEDLLG